MQPQAGEVRLRAGKKIRVAGKHAGYQVKALPLNKKRLRTEHKKEQNHRQQRRKQVRN